jgi:hypothetical protein
VADVLGGNRETAGRAGGEVGLSALGGALPRGHGAMARHASAGYVKAARHDERD